MTRKIIWAAAISLLAITLPSTTRILAEGTAAAAPEQPSLAKNLLGSWILVGTPDKIGEAPATGGRLKFLTGKNWTVTQADPETGVTVFHHGGTYALKGDQYAETIEYANESTKNLIKQTFKFTIKVEGDTLTIIGIGNPWTEVWKRVK